MINESTILINKPLFSILIANYNNGKYISEAVDSVIAQTYAYWEIIIVDDKSTDNFLEIIQPYLKDTRIKLYHNASNNGCGFTKKRCIDEANGVLCAFLDPDDALTKDALSEMVEQFVRFPNSGIINSHNYYCDENLAPTTINPYSKEVPNNGPYIYYNDGSVTHFAVFRRDFYMLTEGLSIQYTKAVDQDLYLLMDQMGPIHFLDKVLYYYRIHKGGISTFKNMIPATYQHYKIIKQSSFGQIKRAKTSLEKKNLRRVYYRSVFHLAMLEKKRLKSVCLLIIYAINGGMNDIMSMFKRLLLNPKRVFNSITKTYTLKSKINEEKTNF